jgi:uncharacterized protein (TIGR03790 family)
MKLFLHLILMSLVVMFSAPALVIAKDLSASVIHRPSQLQPKNVAVVYNINDPDSAEVARYYLRARQIPEKNLIGVKLPVKGGGVVNPAEFNPLKASIDAQLTEEMQVMVLMWKTPFAVRCNSITSALTLGFDEKQCDNACGTGKPSPYFNSASLHPYRDLKIRPSMLLPTDDVPAAKALIDRGVLAGFSVSDATGYFLRTSDTSRSKPREPFFPPDFSTVQSRKLKLRSPKQEFIKDKKDVMFYLTGQAEVKHLDTINFLPGAIADHLTSAGGILDKPIQMQSTKWLEAGATGSYGAVTEPCNYWQKFPNAQVLLSHYLAGETLIESYWKSVAWPAQGLFIGEPLAAPYFRISPMPTPSKQEEQKSEPLSSTENESSL